MAKRIKRDDHVVIVAGKDKGKRGRVLRVMHDDDRVVVEGCNVVVRHKRANQQNPAAGGRVELEAPIHISNVMPWSDKDGKGVRVRIGEEKGKKIRLSSSGAKLVAAAAPAAEKKPKKKKKAADKGDEE